MSATPAILIWAEALGEAIGRGLAAQLQSLVARGPVPDSAPVDPAPTVRRPRRVSKAERAPRQRRVTESVEGFAPGMTVAFRVGRRDATGSILTVDEEAGELTLLDLDTRDVVKRRPSEVRRVAPAPVLVRKRASAPAAGSASAPPGSGSTAAPASESAAAQPSAVDASTSSESAQSAATSTRTIELVTVAAPEPEPARPALSPVDLAIAEAAAMANRNA